VFHKATAPPLFEIVGWNHVHICRWSVEAFVIKEVQAAPQHQRNKMLLLLRTTGVCDVDKKYIDNGDDVLDPDEAAALLRLEEFDFSECSVHYWRSCLWVMLQGLAFRLIAFIALRLRHRDKKV
jgi:hypothetical protein